MRALVLVEPGRIELQQRPDPRPGPGEVLLKVEATTLCGTDLRIISGAKTAGVRQGVIMGHEIAGRIAALGEGVSGYEVGQQAAPSIVISCNHCRVCLLGLEHLCENLRLIGYEIDGGLADYCLIPAQAVAQGNLVTTRTEVNPTHLALAEPLSCCINAANQYRVQPGDVVAVLGAGPIGLLHLQLAQASGASQVIVSNRSVARRAPAAALGAVAVGPDEVQQAVLEATGGLGADVVVVCIGEPALASVALDLARPGGRVSYFAGFPKGSTAEVDVNLLHYKELEVTGGSNARRRDVRAAVRLLESGHLNADAIVTHTFALDDAPAAYDAVRDRLGVKIAVTP
ncbi:MAG: alcohol dehydrogenase catalytic domain-containing protein [Micropruina sp.]|nr:alcohol dehydrogenase catalytic domain-containing protein [Micropruina sp.]